MADTIPKQYKGVVYNEPGKISTKVETLDMPYAHLPTVVPLHRMLDIEFGLLAYGNNPIFHRLFAKASPTKPET